MVLPEASFRLDGTRVRNDGGIDANPDTSRLIRTNGVRASESRATLKPSSAARKGNDGRGSDDSEVLTKKNRSA
jgi:hypothetical protein